MTVLHSVVSAAAWFFPVICDLFNHCLVWLGAPTYDDLSECGHCPLETIEGGLFTIILGTLHFPNRMQSVQQSSFLLAFRFDWK